MPELSIAEMRRIDDLCERFESGDGTDLTACLMQARPAERTVLFLELVAIDIERRLGEGDSVDRDDYQALAESVGVDLSALRFAALLPSADSSDEPPPRSDRYRFDRIIGRGGIGQVWRVYDTIAQRWLAMKMLRSSNVGLPDAEARLVGEALLSGQLQHPGVPPIYDHGRLEPHGPYFTMKLVAGKTLAAILTESVDQQERHGVDRSIKHLEIFENLAQTIAYAHARGIIHRDLKPQNVMVGSFGEVQVMDWGLAKQVGAPEASATQDAASAQPSGNPALIGASLDQIGNADTPPMHELTRYGDVVGTPNYMAPEQARGETERINAATDVFGLGAILFQVLSGQVLHGSASTAGAVAASASEDFQFAAGVLAKLDVDETLRGLCQRCLQPSPDDRPQDASVVATAVSQYLVSTQQRLQELKLRRQREKLEQAQQRRTLRIWLATATVVAIAGVIAAIVFANQSQRINRAVIAEAEAKRKAQAESEISEEANEFLLDILASPLPSVRGRDVTLREAIEASLPDLDSRFVNRPIIAARIRNTLGETYRRIGRIEDGVRFQRESLELLRNAEGVDPELLMRVKDRLAGSLRSLKEDAALAEAAQLRTEVVQYYRQALGPRHPDTLGAMNNLAVVLMTQEKWTEASTLLDEIYLRPETADLYEFEQPNYMVNYTKCLSMTGETAKAESFLRAIIAHREENDLHESLGNATSILAEMLSEQGRFDEAEPLYMQCIEVRSWYLGGDHETTISAKRKYARSLVAAKEFEEAVYHMESFLRDQEKVFGRGAGITFRVRKDLARCLLKLGRRDEADEVMQRTVDYLTRERGPDHEYTKEAIEMLESSSAARE